MKPKPPFLRRVCIRNFKSIAYCDVKLEALTILVGRNASGKSNFIEALLFLRNCIAMNLEEAYSRHGHWGIFRADAEGEPLEIRLEWSFEERSICYHFKLYRDGYKYHGTPEETAYLGDTMAISSKEGEYLLVPHCDAHRLAIQEPAERDFVSQLLRTANKFKFFIPYHFDTDSMRQAVLRQSGEFLSSEGKNLANVLNRTRKRMRLNGWVNNYEELSHPVLTKKSWMQNH